MHGAGWSGACCVTGTAVTSSAVSLSVWQRGGNVESASLKSFAYRFDALDSSSVLFSLWQGILGRSVYHLL